MFSQDDLSTIVKVAVEEGHDPAAILAITHIESGGRSHAIVRGRREPPIRFEAHYFDRRLSGERRAAARKAGLAAEKAGAIANPASQEARWALLEKAARIDRRAAYESTSWGIGQVMGAHWLWLGFDSVEALVEEARSGLGGQLHLMLRYIEKADLAAALSGRDWTAFARGYNGPAFRKTGYHVKLARAYQRYALRVGSTAENGLRRGARGEAVRDLQRLLCALGHPLDIDGVFGPLTGQAVARFQKAEGLVANAVADEETVSAMRGALPFGSGTRFRWTWLMRMAVRLFRRAI